MKLKQITLHDAIQCAGDGNVYIMIRLTDDTPVEQLRQADGYFVEEEAEPVNDVPKSPAGFAYLKTTVEEPEEEPEEDKPVQKKGKYDVGKICALRRANWSISKIAEEMGCSDPTVRKILKQEGMV